MITWWWHFVWWRERYICLGNFWLKRRREGSVFQGAICLHVRLQISASSLCICFAVHLTVLWRFHVPADTFNQYLNLQIMENKISHSWLLPLFCIQSKGITSLKRATLALKINLTLENRQILTFLCCDEQPLSCGANNLLYEHSAVRSAEMYTVQVRTTQQKDLESVCVRAACWHQ